METRAYGKIQKSYTLTPESNDTAFFKEARYLRNLPQNFRGVGKFWKMWNLFYSVEYSHLKTNFWQQATKLLKLCLITCWIVGWDRQYYQFWRIFFICHPSNTTTNCKLIRWPNAFLTYTCQFHPMILSKMCFFDSLIYCLVFFLLLSLLGLHSDSIFTFPIYRPEMARGIVFAIWMGVQIKIPDYDWDILHSPVLLKVFFREMRAHVFEWDFHQKFNFTNFSFFRFLQYFYIGGIKTLKKNNPSANLPPSLIKNELNFLNYVRIWEIFLFHFHSTANWLKSKWKILREEKNFEILFLIFIFGYWSKNFQLFVGWVVKNANYMSREFIWGRLLC